MIVGDISSTTSQFLLYHTEGSSDLQCMVCFIGGANASTSSFYGSRVPYEPSLLEQGQDDNSDHWHRARFRNMYKDSDDGETRQEELWSDIKSFTISEVLKIEQSMTDTSQRIQGLEDNVGSLKKNSEQIMMSDGNPINTLFPDIAGSVHQRICE